MNKNCTAIVYTSNTGHTEKYARLLAGRTGLKAYDLKEAKKSLPRDSSVIYMGWLMAGNVQGYKDAAKLFRVQALCAVGMARGDGQLTDIRKNHPDTASMPVFCLQGGFEMDKLHGIYKMMMKTMAGTVGKKLSAKPDRTEEEEEMLKLFLEGGDLVAEEDLDPVSEWFNKCE